MDARPTSTEDRAYVRVKVAGFDDLGGGKGRLRLDWEVLQPVPEAYHVFIHFTTTQRQKDSAAGGMVSRTARPTTELDAQKNAASDNSK